MYVMYILYEFAQFGFINAPTRLKWDIIRSTDIDNAAVVLNTRGYNDKMQKLLDDPTYKPITTDAITFLKETIRTKINNAPLSEETKKSVIPRKKIHKVAKDAHFTFTRYLANRLKPYGEQMTSYAKDADHLITSYINSMWRAQTC
ncbi:hypothetical protein Trydic_g18480 [Trypoxylus dichotomus]